MFAFFTGNKDKAEPRKSMGAPPGPARPWPFIASSPPVQRMAARRSLSLPQHVAIFADTQGLSRQNSRDSNASTPSSVEHSPSRTQSFSFEEARKASTGSVQSPEEYRADKHQMRSVVTPQLF